MRKGMGMLKKVSGYTGPSEFNPGDTQKIVITVPGVLRRNEYETLRERLDVVFPDQKVLVFGGGMSIATLPEMHALDRVSDKLDRLIEAINLSKGFESSKVEPGLSSKTTEE